MSAARDNSLKQAHGIQWIAGQDLEGLGIDPSMHAWLLEKALLTGRLQRCCGDRFRLEVLREPADGHIVTDDFAPETGLRREIIMWCEDTPCIYAVTSIPPATADAHPWLQKLGSEPLGERLQSRADVSRGAFEFAAISADLFTLGPTAGPQIAADATFWARRSSFNIHDNVLWVTEVFLPGLTGCEPGE